MFYIMENYIFWFYVSVNYFKRVDLVNSITYLTHDEGYSCLWERLRFFELMIELTSSSNFKNNVDVGNIIKAAIHFDDVGMI